MCKKSDVADAVGTARAWLSLRGQEGEHPLATSIERMNCDETTFNDKSMSEHVRRAHKQKETDLSMKWYTVLNSSPFISSRTKPEVRRAVLKEQVGKVADRLIGLVFRYLLLELL
jgi:hypothetical protein